MKGLVLSGGLGLTVTYAHQPAPLGLAQLEHSILLDGAMVRDVRDIHGSMVGRAAEVGRGEPAPRRHRLILGDHTRVEIAP
jgi:glucose-1-phosphate thymidylyltransferase